jgi:hypothetical protein
LPSEAIYVVPVYAVIIAGCLGRDRGVLEALCVCAIGSTALVGAAGMAIRRDGARALYGAVSLAANLALFYGAIHAAGLIDTLIVTIGLAAPPSG